MKKDGYCIMSEMPYCPSCEFGGVQYPDWVETHEDAQNCEWTCSCTKEKYEKWRGKMMKKYHDIANKMREIGSDDCLAAADAIETLIALTQNGESAVETNKQLVKRINGLQKAIEHMEN